MTDREIFRQNLQELMRITKTKQVDIAKYTGVSYQTVSAWVTGRGYPRAEAMGMLCKYFNVRQSDLTEDHNAKANPEETLVHMFRSMSASGQDKLFERAEELLKLYPRGKA